MRLSFSEIGSGASLRIHVLASGSKGNATIVEDAESGRALLVDCGICKREFFARCADVGIDPAHIEGILITHEHTDHTKGLGVVLRGLAKQGLYPVLYASDAVRQASAEIGSIQDSCDIRSFKEGDALSVAGLETQVFMTSHDAAESFGFRFTKNADDSIGYMTDTGIVTPQASEALQNCRILAIESNHDRHMLETGPYPYMLKQRVASDNGHLSNAQAADVLERLLSAKLEYVVAMHISENNNTYRMPSEALAEVLMRNSHRAQVCSAYQQRTVSV